MLFRPLLFPLPAARAYAHTASTYASSRSVRAPIVLG